jgi:hypothetical protein
MSDFEGRVTEALRAESEAAPDALGLAAAVRGRARTRRRRVAAIGAGAVAALVVPLAVVAVGGDDGGDGGDETPVADDDAGQVSTGRWESWHGLTVQVPDDWQYGDLATYCANGGSADEFRIGRPGGVLPMILCTPGSSYGVTFQDIDMKATDEPFDWPVVTQTGEAWPPGTFVGAHGEDGVLVTVAGPDQKAVVEILGTVTAYGATDPNGCSARVEDDQLPVSSQRPSMSVCRYDATGTLEQSERLVGDDATSAGEALDGMTQGDLDCRPADVPGPTIDMYDGERDVTIELNGACTVAEGSPEGIVDPDVLWWALSPGFSGETTGLNMGSVLRTYDPAA